MRQGKKGKYHFRGEDDGRRKMIVFSSLLFRRVLSVILSCIDCGEFTSSPELVVLVMAVGGFILYVWVYRFQDMSFIFHFIFISHTRRHFIYNGPTTTISVCHTLVMLMLPFFFLFSISLLLLLFFLKCHSRYSVR